MFTKKYPCESSHILQTCKPKVTLSTQSRLKSPLTLSKCVSRHHPFPSPFSTTDIGASFQGTWRHVSPPSRLQETSQSKDELVPVTCLWFMSLLEVPTFKSLVQLDLL